MSLLNKIKDQQTKSSTAHLKYIKGEYGLPKTFWLFWFLPIAIITVVDAFTRSGRFSSNILIIIWSIAALLAVYNTTNNKKIWKNIAIVVIGLTILSRIFNVLVG